MLDHQQFTARLEHAPHFAESMLGIVDGAEDQRDYHAIKALVGEGEAFHWSLDQVDRYTGCRRPGTGIFQHHAIRLNGFHLLYFIRSVKSEVEAIARSDF